MNHVNHVNHDQEHAGYTAAGLGVAAVEAVGTKLLYDHLHLLCSTHDQICHASWCNAQLCAEAKMRLRHSMLQASCPARH